MYIMCFSNLNRILVVYVDCYTKEFSKDSKAKTPLCETGNLVVQKSFELGKTQLCF